MNGDDLQCREVLFGSAEYEALVALRDEVLRRPLGLTFSAAQLAAERTERHFACYLGGELVGCLLLRRLDDARVQMRQVAVRAQAQGRGVGRAMVESAEAWASALGYRTMMLHAREEAVGFYERLGYARVGGRFMEVTLPHWEMRKTL